MESKRKPIIVILGQTASGKSALAMRLAQRYGGEIIAADSRTIYKGMDIGTAKPTLQDQQQIQHYGIDLVTPDMTFSAAEFQSYTNEVVKNIHLPMIVGGTGLYIDGFVYGFEFGSEPDPVQRKILNSLSINELQNLAVENNLDPEQVNFKNPRHLARAIERVGQKPANRMPKPDNVMLVGLKIDKEQLRDRIASRVDTMFDGGLINEVQNLISLYGETAPGLLSPGYKEVIEHLNGRLSLEECKGLIARNHRLLAKRQNTWFKRNPDIIWCENEQQADNNVRAFLTKFATIDS